MAEKTASKLMKRHEIRSEDLNPRHLLLPNVLRRIQDVERNCLQRVWSRSESALRASSPMISDLWYNKAVIYCLSVGTFMDSNGDGIGDFKGLTRRLDYLHGLITVLGS
jgi:hypothetical protein